MSTLTKAQQTERQETIARLQEWLKPGDTIHCILRHVSASGMSHVIDLVALRNGADGQAPSILSIGWNAADALGRKYDREYDGIKIGGCGMDMGFALVYDLGTALYPDGVPCTGAGCNSNDHRNGDRDYTPGHMHQDGGYAFEHRWL